ncbi:peptidoglycan editing factor PgeF [Hydrogenovibrio kuenenii]|uniref:peptidoglycan editing factor PgeF n=1 Tax=Hydrogenovibrio kuenenii TaxID=63658 RepID=UPI000464FF02|nr:peptidoglycan editing factor PgeF [Hydrogenovibrio kuenenii]
MPISQIDDLTLIRPDWPVSSKVKAFTTTRQSGISKGVYDSFNLATHVKDDSNAVVSNRKKLQQSLQLPTEPFWLNQQHTSQAVAFSPALNVPVADAAWTQTPGQVLTVMTADCLPIILVDNAETMVAVIHAGWRGLADGIIENILKQLPITADQLQAWIGPAISQQYFEVGGEVLDAFVEKRVQLLDCFKQSEADATKYFADLPSLADFILKESGVNRVTLSSLCSYAQPELFYSYRRDGETGRMATLIWLDANN